MLGKLKIGLIGLVVAAAVSGTAFAGMRDPVDVFVSGRVEISGSPFLMVGERSGFAANQDQVDYAVFVRELIAFVAKEVIPDTADEYAGSSSNIPSRLSSEMPHQRSKFGEHCLIILAEIGSHLSPMPGGSSLGTHTPSFLAYLARAGTTVLAVEQLWSAWRNEITDERSGFSLDPKVGSKKVGAYLTFRW